MTRSHVEQTFAVLKLRFGFLKLRYWALANGLPRLCASSVLIKSHLITAQNPAPLR